MVFASRIGLLGIFRGGRNSLVVLNQEFGAVNEFLPTEPRVEWREVKEDFGTICCPEGAMP
jgi:hypothetical protein